MSSMWRVIPILTLALLVMAAPAEAGRRVVPQGFYGVMWDRGVEKAPPAVQEDEWALMARSGVESVRTPFVWAKMQDQAGAQPDFSETDRLVTRAAAHRIKLLPVVLGTPFWAARYPRESASPPRRPADYAAFLRRLVQRYGPRGSFWDEYPELPRRPVREWQIWNEVHFNAYWQARPGRPNSWAPDYVRLLRASKRAIEGVDRRATIVLSALADFSWDHLERLYRAGAGGHFDLAAVNLFTSRPANVIKGLRRVRGVMRRHRGGRRPLWLTESTWPAAKGRVPPPGPAWQRAWYTTDPGMASRLTELYRLAVRNRRLLRLARVYWYTWSSPYWGSEDLFEYSGLSTYAGGAFDRHPALAAYTASARRHEGCAKTSAGTCAP